MICMCLFVYISQVWNLPNPSGNMILGWKPCLRTSIQARTLHCVQGYWALLPYKPRDMDTSPTWETQWRIAYDILDHEMVRNVCLLGLFIRREISCRNQGLEIIDPTADAVVFGDANLSFALNLARHRRSDASNSRFSRKGWLRPPKSIAI